MSSLVSIDPGLNSCGVAVWSNELPGNPLLWAALARNHGSTRRTMIESVYDELAVQGYTPDRLVIEVPQVYVRTRSKGDPNDLIQLALVVGGFECTFRGAVFLTKPAEWKHQVPKPIMQERILKRLSDDEKSHVTKAPKSLMHNVWDSVGIGLARLGRL